MEERPEVDASAGLPPRYRVERSLGAGSFGEVLLAHDRDLDRPVAIKLLHSTLEDLEVRQRFEREARLTAALEHPNVVRVFDHGYTETGMAYIVYQAIEGEDLRSHLERVGSLPPARVRALGAPLAEALAAAHEQGVLHRDVKPGNVLLGADGQPLLCDFGIARATHSDGLRTPTGVILGTPAFMAPELFRGEPASPASEQFALAALLFECLHGVSPYPVTEAGELVELLSRPGWSARSPPGPTPDPALEAILTKGLDTTPSARHADLRTLAAELAGSREVQAAASPRCQSPRDAVTVACRGDTDRAPPDGDTRSLRGPRPRPAVRRWLTGGALLLLFLALGWWYEVNPPRPPAPAASPRVDPEEKPDRIRAARRALRREWLQVSEGHRSGDGQDCCQSSTDPHVLDVEERLVDPRFPLQVKRLVEALQEWLLALVEAGDLATALDREPDHGWMRRTGISLLEHLVYDLKTIPEAGTRQEFLRYSGEVAPPRPADRPAVLSRIFEELREILESFVKFQRALPEPRPLLILASAAQLSSGADFEGAEEDLLALAFAVRKMPGAASPLRIHQFGCYLLGCIGRTALWQRLPCERRREVLAIVQNLLPEGSLPGRPGWCDQDMLELADEEIRAALLCRAECSQGVVERVVGIRRRYLEVLTHDPERVAAIDEHLLRFGRYALTGAPREQRDALRRQLERAFTLQDR